MPEPRARSCARFIRVELSHIHLRLDGRPVLRDVSWRIEPGERWILMGPNGAGKTQLLKLLAGDVWPSPSRLAVRRYRLRGEIFDDPYGVREQIAYLGPERQDRYEHYEWNHRVTQIVGTGLHRTDIPLTRLSRIDRQRVHRLLERLRIDSLAQRAFLTLSYGERRLVLLARALAWRPALLLMDEPFSGLDPLNRQRLVAALRTLNRSRLPWVLSTHRLEDLAVAATHVCRIEGGRIRSLNRLGPKGILPDAGTEPPSAGDGRRQRRGRSTASRGPARTLIALHRASVWREGARVLRNISCEVASGDCWVVHGPNGSGKSSLIKLLYGELGVARGGSIFRDGIVPGVPLSVFQHRAGLVAPELQTLYPRYELVADVVASGLHASVGLNEATTPGERRSVQRALRRVQGSGLQRRALRTLSYGQMRRVLFARALVNEPDILLLDEPYAGLDARTRAAMQGLVEQAVQAGVTTVITTHHNDEWPVGISHEIELRAGEASYCGPVRPR